MFGIIDIAAISVVNAMTMITSRFPSGRTGSTGWKTCGVA